MVTKYIYVHILGVDIWSRSSSLVSR